MRPIVFPQLHDPSWLRTRYLDQGRSLREIAAEVGCNYITVRDALERAGIARRPRGTRPRGEA